MANGYVRYGNSIHLDGFQILDFCIENAISLESLRDLNLGRKVFLTGNDTNAGYLRENVWDGDRWRAAAYLDDIEKITNGEGSLGTRVKALEDMLKMDDANDAINTWAEIQKFLENIDEGLDLMTMLDGKLDKTGGVMELDSSESFMIKRKTESGSTIIKFANNNGTLGYLGVDSTAPVYYNAKGNMFTIIHSGNALDLITGTLGVDITGNAATATKLKNKVSLWGNEFDGTQDLGGSISFKDGDKLRSILDYTSNSELHLGYGTRTLNLTIWGTPIYFYANNTRAMTITDGGRVVVGPDASVDGDKLYSRGRVNILSLCDNPTLGNMPEYGLVMTDNRSTLGIAQWVSNGTGAGNIQVGRFDGTATAYALNLNPLGGAVNVGDGGLNVAGNVIASKINSDVSISVKNENGKIGLYTSENRGVYDFSTNMWVLGTNGTNTFLRQGNVIIGGQIDNESGAKLQVAGSATFSNRVLIGGAVADDGETALQVTGLIKVYDSSSKNYVAKYSGTGVQFLLTSGKRNLVSRIDKDGKNIGALAFDSIPSDPNTLYYISFRDDTSIWFTINSTASSFNVATTFNGGALIPTGQKLTIGSVTFEEDADGRIKVDGNLYTTGTLASGGKAKEGTGTGSGSANVRDFELPADGKTTYDCDHLLKSKNVIVQVFEKAIQNNIEVWEMIVADVTIVTEDRVTVTFGRPTTKVHKVHIIGGNVS